VKQQQALLGSNLRGITEPNVGVRSAGERHCRALTGSQFRSPLLLLFVFSPKGSAARSGSKSTAP